MRLLACYASLVEARKNAAPDVEALEEREREALVHEVSAIIDDTREALLRFSACYEGFVEDNQTTVQEVEAVSQMTFRAGLALLRASQAFLIGQPPEVGEQLGAIIARAGEVSQQATAEALKFIDDARRRG